MAHVKVLGENPRPEDLEDAEPIYREHAVHDLHPPPEGLSGSWQTDGKRKKILHTWGKMREIHMHRAPNWCMDQLVSGSGLYPPRHLTNDWFTLEELEMIRNLETQLAETNHGAVLARDMMALKIFNIDIRIILDDSGSMSLSMFGRGEYVGSTWDQRHIQQVFGARAFTPDTLGSFMNTGCHLRAGDSRWNFLVDAVNYWEPIFKIMKHHPTYYTMNRRETFTDAKEACARGPIGGTPTGSTFARVLQDIARIDPDGVEPHLIICLTDGEANDGPYFNSILDSIQDGAYGDVQVMLMGLSLEPEDIKFFEDEECDDTRIRTIEAYEVEQQMILWRKVIDRSTDYNFAMHSVRALVTNFFPGDYDYEAPIQTLRHRLYITLHALDRRITCRRDNTYSNPGDCDCFAGLMGGGGGRAGPRGGTADSAEAELAEILNDPRFDALMHQLRPPPKQAQQYGMYGGYGWGGQLPQNLRNAIGALQPNEFQNRDLQFANITQNAKSVRLAVQMMCKAIGDEQLATSVGGKSGGGGCNIL